MIFYQVTYDGKHISSLSVSGHAGYKQKGRDIVCAAVSTAILMTANAMEVLKSNHLVDLNVASGDFKCMVKTYDSINQGLLINLEYALKELEKEYPKYIKNQKEG